MINEAYVLKLLRLIKMGVISIDNILDPEYKAEVERRLGL